ncbi:MAG: HEAT repeat domain-containing protein [Coriobacteriia bacterium]
MYPPSSDIPRAAAAACAEILSEAFLEVPDMRLTVAKTGLLYNGVPLFPGTKGFSDFSYELYLRKLAEVRFHVGVQGKDVIDFLSVLKLTPREVETSGGYEARLWYQGVSTITVREMRVTLVETQLDPSQIAAEPSVLSDAAEVDDALAAALADRDYDSIALTRLIGDSDAIRNYLQQVYAANASRAALVAVGQRFSALAEVASKLGTGNQHEIFRILAEAISGLDAKLQRDLLIQEVLPESRTYPALAGVVRQAGFDAVFRLFTQKSADGQIDKEQLVRAIRGLVLISASERQDVADMAASVMLGAGINDGDIADILEQAMPTKLTVRPSAPAGEARPAAETIFKLLDLSNAPRKLTESSAQLLALRAEAARGIADGDVIAAMVALVGFDIRPAQFASTMSMIEDSLDYLIESGAVEVAADAAISLGQSATIPALAPGQRVRIEQAIDQFARPSDVRELARTMRVYPKGSPEYGSARRLIDLLGSRAIKPLLENLADEPDMAARKALVDILSTMVNDYIGLLGACVGDSRWYFVRNVVAILASAKSASVLVYLERTLRHADPRVRRETIRGLSGITDRLARQMLVGSLNDVDAQNVQLASRYLGQVGDLDAVPALEAVARGEGRGSRDTGPRVEAIEALGRLGATQSLPTLESLAGKHSLLGAGRGKELRAAATAAVSLIRAKGATR